MSMLTMTTSVAPHPAKSNETSNDSWRWTNETLFCCILFYFFFFVKIMHLFVPLSQTALSFVFATINLKTNTLLRFPCCNLILNKYKKKESRKKAVREIQRRRRRLNAATAVEASASDNESEHPVYVLVDAIREQILVSVKAAKKK